MWMEKQREHLMGVGGYLGAGLLTLAEVKSLLTLHQAAGALIGLYLFGVALWSLYHIPVERSRLRGRRIQTLVRGTSLAMMLSFGSGFWMGFSRELEAGFRIPVLHYNMALFFGSLTVSLATITLVGALGHLSLAMASPAKASDEDLVDGWSLPD